MTKGSRAPEPIRILRSLVSGVLHSASLERNAGGACRGALEHRNPLPVPARRTEGQESNETEATLMQLTPYLLLPGTCKEAMTFYQGVFGGDLVMTSVGESPMKGMFPEVMHSRIVHAKLKSQRLEISASDWLRPSEAAIPGNTVCLYLSGAGREETKAAFSKLSAGAQVTDPLREQPFGLYGALNDRFGHRWMFQCD